MYRDSRFEAGLQRAPITMDSAQAIQYLDGLLGRQLRVHATDSRMFVGIFKCTDAVSSFS